MEQFITGEVPELDGDEAKAAHKKSMAKDKRSMSKDKRIIAYSIKDHLIPDVSSFNTLNEVYDTLEKMFKGNNINQNITLRNQLKNVKIHKSETIQS